MSPGLSLGLLALVGLGLLGWQVFHARPRLSDAVGRLAPALGPLGLEPDGGEESFEHCVQRYRGQVHGRPTRLRVLERPGRERLLVWVDLRAPALEAAALRSWSEAAEQRDLELGSWSLGVRPIVGVLRGRPVRAEATLEGTVVRAEIAGALLQGIRRVVHKDLGEGTPTGNAVMDMLVAVEGKAPVWNDEERVSATLEVVHAWRGSELRPSEVVLRANRDLGEEVGPALDAVARLAELCST